MKLEIQDSLSLLLTHAPTLSDHTAAIARELEQMEGALRVVAEKDPGPDWSFGLRTSIVAVARHALGEDDDA